MSDFKGTNVVKYYNGEAWSFTQDDDDSISSVTFGKRYLMGGLNKTSSLNQSNSGGFASGNSKSSSSNKSSTVQNKAMIKISGHNHNAGKLKAHIDYITRNGSIEMEDNQGEEHTGNNQKAYKDWVLDHEERLNNSKERHPRIATSFVISAPPDSSPDLLYNSVREFTSKAFNGHRYLMVLHSEETEANEGKITKHPHVHIVVERRSPDNEKALKTNVRDLMNWRKEFSEIAQSHGLDLSYKRGEISKQRPGASNRNIYAMLKKGEIPEEYKVQYAIAKKRVLSNRVFQSTGEKKLVEKAINDFTKRQIEISDLSTMIDNSASTVAKNKYSNEKKYLEYINSSQRMPVSNSQLFLKFAIYEKKAVNDKAYKFNASVPTIKHYMYALKIAESHAVDLPPTANIDSKMLTGFIKQYSDRPTEKLIKYVNDIAADRGLEIRPGILDSQKSTRAWLRNNIKHATIKAMDKAYKLSDQFNVDVPKNLSAKSISAFINTYSKIPSDKMIDYANNIAQRTNNKLDKELLKDKSELSKWISQNTQKKREMSKALKELTKYNVDKDVLQDIKQPQIKIDDKHVINIAQKGVAFPKDKINDSEYKLNYVRSHGEFSESKHWNKLKDQLNSKDKTISKDKSSRDDFDRI